MPNYCEIDRLRAALWQCFTDAGGDTDGKTDAAGISTDDLISTTTDCVKDLRLGYDEMLYESSEADRLRARVAKLESARGEPVAWMNPYGGTLQVRITGLEYEKYTIPLYTAPPAQAVEQAYDLASEFFGSGLPHYIADWVVPAIMRAAEIERETCAQKCLERHANGRFKHDTRDECADAIRAMGE